MPNKNYRKGYGREKKTVAELHDFGYTCMESRGSKGAFDVVASRVVTRWIQVKSNNFPPRDELVKLSAIADRITNDYVICEIWVWVDNHHLAEIWRWSKKRKVWTM